MNRIRCLIRSAKLGLYPGRCIQWILFIILTTSFCDKLSHESWISLFNGKDLSGWKVKIAGHQLNDNYKNTFRVEDGLLKVSYDQYDQFDEKFGHLFYKDKFSHYKIRVEYRFIGDQIPGAPSWAIRNNGIMLHCQSPESEFSGFHRSPTPGGQRSG